MTIKLPPQTHMGQVHLSVADLNRSLDYYQRGLGLTLLSQDESWSYLGADSTILLALREKPGARPQSPATGLYHFALLLPSRLDLARTLRHLLQQRIPLSGWSDHAVSEAIYLTDPDGHGIEIYRDRPRSEWEYEQGQLKMTVDPLDVDGILAELPAAETDWKGMPQDTRMGHIHLHVAHMPAALEFYVNQMGFDLMVRYGPQASFVAAGGYHHHLGLNTWAGVGAPPPAADAIRLEWFEIRLPNRADLTQVINHLTSSDIPVHEGDNGYFIDDPSGNRILLRADR
ncbi:MAG: VOC family protein [Chloroflexota bacterium]